MTRWLWLTPIPLALLLIPLGWLGAGGFDPAADRFVAQVTGGILPTLATSATYLRDPALATPAAPFSDLPGGPDHFPAAGWIAPAPLPLAHQIQESP
ncbi:MAG: hypothetical protein COX57_05040 [Alphaproteobacteria bacterium CG_4_10_14_0_2_um_filter_63_37]|nr:MAG: hypothetical protein AUJ55_05215 [Proteobacteria bacterium CG1_02_64_396]PJA25095.1 MAG: hypothetical protein COX57_05040 [Alphaproteobacteria bacterium CG_4_10_14_0_2_um_filter_63_37]